MKKFILTILVLLLVVVGAGWIFLPKVLESSLQSYLEQEVPAQKITVSVPAANPLQLLSGTVGEVKATGEKVLLDKMTYDKVDIDLKDVTFKVGDLLWERRFTPTYVGGGQILATLTQEELQSYIQKEVGHIENVRVHIDARQVNVSGDVDIAGLLKGNLQILGQVLIDDNKLVVMPEGLRFNNMGISGLGSQLMKKIEVYDFRKFPIPVKATGIQLQEGKVTATAVPVAGAVNVK